MKMLKALYMIVMLFALPALFGCAGPQAQPAAEPLRLEGVARSDVLHSAEQVLSSMHFAIEKMDVEQGVIRTRPLRGGQFFELWRQDNVGLANALEANLHTIRRSVELRITDDAGRMGIACDVRIERLSLPENEVASISQTYRIYSRSTPSMQRLELDPRQKRAMAWLAMGRDSRLETEILRRIAQRTKQSEQEKRT